MNKTTFAAETEHNGIRLTLVGQWQDITAYYRGDNGEAWIYNHCTRSWSNNGNYAEFVEHFSKNHRGELKISFHESATGQPSREQPTATAMERLKQKRSEARSDAAVRRHANAGNSSVRERRREGYQTGNLQTR